MDLENEKKKRVIVINLPETEGDPPVGVGTSGDVPIEEMLFSLVCVAASMFIRARKPKEDMFELIDSFYEYLSPEIMNEPCNDPNCICCTDRKNKLN